MKIRSIARGLSSLNLGSKNLVGSSAPVYISNSLDPYFNLSYEEFLFRNTDPSQPKLLIYRNCASVIIGRNQNPWTEARTKNLWKREVPLVRRRSGGGTVYHDEGNTNYSIMIPRELFDRRVTGELVAQSLIALGLPSIRLNERHDICLGPDKVSGSAYKIIRDRAYHHGTMLINSDLSNLHDFLHPAKSRIVSKAIDSVRSPVTNLRSASSRISHESFSSSLAQTFTKTYYPRQTFDKSPKQIVEREVLEHHNVIREGMEELQSWEWTFGQTPEFSNTISVNGGSTTTLDIELQVRYGKIQAVNFPALNPSLHPDIEDRIRAKLLGQQYGIPPSSDYSTQAQDEQWVQWIVDSVYEQM